jgi:pimeloyl-ACP methyl ester carboxylesterase
MAASHGGGSTGLFPRLRPAARLAVFLLTEAAVVTVCAAICSAAAEILYAAAVPTFLVYAALYRWDLAERPPWRYVAYFVALALVVTAGLVALSRTMPHVSISGPELLAAVYFMASLHILLWAMDRVSNAGLAKVLGIHVDRGNAAAGDHSARRAAVLPQPTRFRSALLSVLRVVVLLALGGPLVASALATHGPKFVDTSDPHELCGVRFEPAGFRAADGVGLKGWFIPAHCGTAALGCARPGAGVPQSDTTVIIVPARGMGKAAFLPHATMLTDDGFNVLVMDLRGEGESDGHTRGFGAIEGQDVTGAVEYLRQARPAQSRHIFALGVSEGASAILAAARTDPRIEAVVIDSAFPRPATELGGMLPPLPWPLGVYFQNATLALASAQLGRNLFERGADRDIAEIGARPILVIQGAGDEVVSESAAEGLYSASRSPSMLWKVQDAPHGQSLAVSPVAYAKVVCTTLRSVRLGMPAFGWTRQSGPAKQG